MTKTTWLAVPLALAACSAPPAQSSPQLMTARTMTPAPSQLASSAVIRNTSCATKVQYNNGHILQSPRVQMIYWGTSWPTLESKSLPDYLDANWQDTLGDPDFYYPLAEYSAGGQTIGVGSWAGSVRVSSNPPNAHVADADVAAFLWQQKSAGKIQAPGPNNFYVVVMGQGYTNANDTDYSTTPPTIKAVAHHGYWIYSDNEEVYYAMVPWDAVSTWLTSVNQLGFERLVINNAVAHEIREGITDPDGTGGWRLPGNGETEIGDYCDKPLTDPVLRINQTQMLGVWSQQQCACVGPTRWPSVGGWIQGGYDMNTLTVLPTSSSYAIANDVNRGNQIELLAIGGDHNLYWKAQDYAWDGNTWWSTGTSGWISKVAAVGTTTGIHVFGIGSDGLVYYQRQDVSGIWSGWSRVGTFTASDLAVQLGGPGSAGVYALGSDGSVREAALIEPSGGTPYVGGWSSLNVPVAARSISVTAINGYTQMSMVGSDDNVYFAYEHWFYNIILHRAYRIWSAWTNLGRPAAGVTQVVMAHTSAQDAGGLRPVVVALAGNVVYRDVRQTDGTTWTGWLTEPFIQQIPDVMQIAVANNAESGVGLGRLEIFALNSRGTTLHLWQTDPTTDWSWSSDLVRGGYMTQLGAGLNGDGRIEIFGVDEVTNEIRHDWQNFGASGTTWQY
jgi:hypothetical protein